MMRIEMRASRFLLCLTLAACSLNGGDAATPPQVTPETMESLKSSALLGDAVAAKALALHFAVSERSPTQENYWWQIAAENGDAGAMRTLALVVLRDRQHDCVRALFWLKRARDSASRSDGGFEDIDAEILDATTNTKDCKRIEPLAPN